MSAEGHATIVDKVEVPRNDKLIGALFLGGIAGMATLGSFGYTLAAAKKRDPSSFDKGLVGQRGVMESGAALATRALFWGTVLATAGCGIFFYGVWKLSGATNMQEFRLKMGQILPKIPRNQPPVGRTDFENLTDLMRYLASHTSKGE